MTFDSVPRQQNDLKWSFYRAMPRIARLWDCMSSVCPSVRNVPLLEMKQCFGAHQKNLNEDRSITLATKCRPMIQVSRNIKYMRILAGVRSRRRLKCYMQAFANNLITALCVASRGKN